MERGKYAPRKKRVVCSAAWSQGISQRLKELGMSKTKLAALCKVSEGSITAWIYGNVHGQPAEPSTGNLIKLANALDTTSDYLLDLTKSPARNNPDLRSACDYTGLSQAAVNALNVAPKGSIHKKVLNLIIENESFQEVVNCVVQTIVKSANLKQIEMIIDSSLSDDYRLVEEYYSACKEANATETLECSLIADKLGFEVFKLEPVNLAKAYVDDYKKRLELHKFEYLKATQKLGDSIIKQEIARDDYVEFYQEEDCPEIKHLKESVATMERAKAIRAAQNE